MTRPLPPPPAELQGITEIIGADGALRLVEEAGGTTIYIPRKTTADSPLVAMIGQDAATRLGDAMGGERVKVPVAKRWRCHLYRSQDMSIAKIARRLGLTEGGVRFHLGASSDDGCTASARVNLSQLDLFGR